MAKILGSRQSPRYRRGAHWAAHVWSRSPGKACCEGACTPRAPVLPAALRLAFAVGFVVCAYYLLGDASGIISLFTGQAGYSDRGSGFGRFISRGYLSAERFADKSWLPTSGRGQGEFREQHFLSVFMILHGPTRFLNVGLPVRLLSIPAVFAMFSLYRSGPNKGCSCICVTCGWRRSFVNGDFVDVCNHGYAA
jgi:hypothetical protein